MGVLPIPSIELNDTVIVCSIIKSEPVTHFRKTFRDTASRDLMNFFRKPKDSFSASEVGFASSALITFLAVGFAIQEQLPQTLYVSKVGVSLQDSKHWGPAVGNVPWLLNDFLVRKLCKETFDILGPRFPIALVTGQKLSEIFVIRFKIFRQDPLQHFPFVRSDV